MKNDIKKILECMRGDESSTEVYIVDVDTAIDQTADAMLNAYKKSVEELKGKQQFK